MRNPSDTQNPERLFFAGILLNWVTLFLLAYHVTGAALTSGLLIVGTALIFGGGLSANPRR